MIFKELSIGGAFLIELELLNDERGFFARSFCQQEFEEHGLNPCIAQCNVSFNRLKGTLRGLHYQAKPYEEAKLVRCIRGSIYDVVLDLRPASASYLKWLALELSSNKYQMLYIPPGCAHGFQTLEDNCEVFYQMSEFYHPEAARGCRWNDPRFNIKWPIINPIFKDQAFDLCKEYQG